MENENVELKDQLAELESRLATFVKEGSTEALNQAYADLSHKLMVSKRAEQELKGKVCSLEIREKEFSESIAVQKRCYNDLVNQLQDHENAVIKAASLERDNSDLLDQIEHLREVERRFKDLQQSEEFFQGRVEELEQTESVSWPTF